jgi:ketosteroid isomerase-like protein
MGASCDFVKSLYAAFGKGDVPTVVGALDSGIKWWEAEGTTYAEGNPYVGPQAVVDGVLARLGADIEGFTVNAASYIDGGDTVVAEGRYRGKVKATGKQLDAQFAHVWQLRDRKVVRFQQYTDTRQWVDAANP